MSASFTIVGLGEALFDLFPGRQVLGGAPLNAAVHAHQLATGHGGRGVVVSRVGQDALGIRLARELVERGMTTEYVQTDPDHMTGRVHVAVDDAGRPEYEIVENVAWDWLQWDPDLDDLAHTCDAVCFSSLSQRHNQARGTVQRFVAEARQAVRMFDLTLRQQFYDARVLAGSCELANVVKLNEEELDVLARLLGMAAVEAEERARALLRQFQLRMVVLTRGERGTVLFTPTGRFEGAAANFPATKDADSVGAGDACAAAVLVGLVLRRPAQQIADAANRVGAFVASVAGATPTLPEEGVKVLN